MKPIAVMQVTDTLIAAGLERVAVNVANALPRDQYESHLCTTRREGPLADLVAPGVHRLRLGRTGRFDVAAIRRLVDYIRNHRIEILHAHGTSLFISVFASLFKPYPIVVWHDHFGMDATEERVRWIYWLATRRVRCVMAVNKALAEWSTQRLGIRRELVSYIPNFVDVSDTGQNIPDLPGEPGFRVVCVANLRPQKDHPTLLRAMRLVLREFPAAHLLLVGQAHARDYLAGLQSEMSKGSLAGHVTWLGARLDVSDILRGCNVGVLSSNSEGFPWLSSNMDSPGSAW
jgi:glycosyltransferase involved in cell wall biosynthesis